MGFFFLVVCKVSSSSVLIFIGDNGTVVLVGGGGFGLIFLLSSSTRNLDNAFSAVTNDDDNGGKDGIGGGDSIVVYVFKVVSKRAFARRFFSVLFVEFVENVRKTLNLMCRPSRRRIQLSREPFNVGGRDDAVIGHERQIDFKI